MAKKKKPIEEEVYVDDSDYSIVPEAPLEPPSISQQIPEITIDLTPLISELKEIKEEIKKLNINPKIEDILPEEIKNLIKPKENEQPE